MINDNKAPRAASKRAATNRPQPRRAATSAAAPPPGIGTLTGAPLMAVARQLRSWTDNVLGVAGPATDLAFGLVRTRATSERQKALIDKAGGALRRMREAAGMTLQEVARAVDLKDPALLEAAEGGKVALPFEVVLRLGGVLGRSDPLTATMKLARAYNPDLWKALDQLGVGRLVAQAGREREFSNLYRANDDARRLGDDDFAAVLAFTKSAFDMAVAFRRGSPRADAKAKAARKRTRP